jgi:hypothetical protein
MTTTTRKNVPIPDDVQGTAERARELGSVERAALEQMGIRLSQKASASEVFSALLIAGQVAVQERVAETGYAAWAASMDAEDIAYRNAMRSRGARRSGGNSAEADAA